MEDRLLVLRCKRGSREAFCRIYEKYKRDLLILAIALLNDASAAEDVLHDVFLAFVRDIRKFRLTGSLKGYLVRCVINHLRDTIRQREHRKTSSLDEAANVAADTQRPVDSAILAEELQRLVDAMAQLPYEQHEVIVMRAYAGIKFKAIAKMQNESINTIQSRYRYGLNKLRSILNGEVKK